MMRAVVAGVVAVIVGAAGLVWSSSRPADSDAEAIETRAAAHIAAAEATSGPRKLTEPLSLVPADAMLSWKGRRLPDQPAPGSELALLGTLFGAGNKIAGSPLKTRDQMTLHIVSTFATMAGYDFAVTLLDASAKPTKEGSEKRQVDDLRLAAIIDVGGDAAPFMKIIQRVINEQTDKGVATLQTQTFVSRSTPARSWTYAELRDERLPEWCVIGWGQIEDYFVISVGDGVWPRIARVAAGDAEALVALPWVTKARKRSPADPLVEIVVAAQEIMDRLDPFVQERATKFFEAWNADDLEQAHWALGFSESAMFCLATFREAERTRVRVFANSNVREAEVRPLVPESARYAVYELPLRRFLPRLVGAFYATRSADDRELAAETWARVQRENNVNAEEDALAHLGKRVLLHNYPPHPLKFPLAFTGLIEIKRNPERVFKTLDTLCMAWRDAIERDAEAKDNLPPLRLKRDDDGVWHVEFLFVQSVAWTFTDKYIVTCWSPAALRRYLDEMGDAVGKRLK